ncbi:DUF982 domain-containing protein [Mesorhizobium loti]|uniref:DUF982 domain-containing protein n=1 Tax=Rhizobium loti TaxID=381 RepID=UPI00047D29C9|nr:DUF982 domain-containing protein [Mesorhizobium loti]
MDLLWFSPAVRVTTDREGGQDLCHNVQSAVAHLQTWAKRGPKWTLAMSVCSAALADKATAQEARRAFRAAAKEEGRLHEL